MNHTATGPIATLVLCSNDSGFVCGAGKSV